jgi:hypothetical protein
MIMRPVSFGMGRMLASGHDLSRSIAETLGCTRARRIRAFTVTIVVHALCFRVTHLHCGRNRAVLVSAA